MKIVHFYFGVETYDWYSAFLFEYLISSYYFELDSNVSLSQCRATLGEIQEWLRWAISAYEKDRATLLTSMLEQKVPYET